VKVVEVSAVEAIDSAQWADLWLRCPDATVFQSRDWLLAWQETFRKPDDSVKVLAVYDGTQLSGLAPLMRERRTGGVHGPERWRLIGEDYSDYQTLLVRDGSQRILDLLLSAADECLPRGATLLLRDVPQFSALGLNLAQRTAHAASGVRAGSAIACPALRIRHNASGVARVLAKSSVIRHERALSRMGEVTVEHFDTAADIEPLLPDFFAQHVARWAGSAHPSLFLNSANQGFYRAVTFRLGPAGGLLFTTVRLDGRIVAQHFGLRSSRSLFWYKPAFDIALRKLSPGEVLLRRLIEFSAQQGLDELDFTRGDEAFKSRFSSIVGFSRHFTWYRRARTRLRAQVIEDGKALVRRLWPAKQAEQHRLGGSLSNAGDAHRVLLLGADRGMAKLIRESFAHSGIEVDDGGVMPAALARPPPGSGLRPSPAQAEAAQAWAATLDQSHRWALIVPCNEAALLALAWLPQDNPIRAKAVLAPLDGLRKVLCSDGAGKVQADKGTELHAPTVAGNAGGRPGHTVLCMYSHGKLGRYYVSANSSGNVSLAAIVQFVKQRLDHAQWHGFAAVTVEQAADSSMCLTHVSPLVGELPQPTPALLAPFLVDLWKIARCEPLGPQPAAKSVHART